MNRLEYIKENINGNSQYRHLKAKEYWNELYRELLSEYNIITNKYTRSKTNEEYKKYADEQNIISEKIKELVKLKDLNK